MSCFLFQSRDREIKIGHFPATILAVERGNNLQFTAGFDVRLSRTVQMVTNIYYI